MVPPLVSWCRWISVQNKHLGGRPGRRPANGGQVAGQAAAGQVAGQGVAKRPVAAMAPYFGVWGGHGPPKWGGAPPKQCIGSFCPGRPGLARPSGLGPHKGPRGGHGTFVLHTGLATVSAIHLRSSLVKLRGSISFRRSTAALRFCINSSAGSHGGLAGVASSCGASRVFPWNLQFGSQKGGVFSGDLKPLLNVPLRQIHAIALNRRWGYWRLDIS